jgi:predicted nucleotidyltransferase
MSPEDRRILQELAQRVGRVEPRARIWAFGSRARGDATPESDLDVCVVVPEVNPALEGEVRRCAWELAFEHGRVIPAIIMSEEAFERGPMSASTLVATIRREGIAA